eukprot:TRINITY_DN5_c0_g2_i1.p1 TRINITY_DN5_c0_g2~~TRINITY_DN5_c0_g2_i1.p1  ORF type:complete len:709 (+),score=165.77 TRINITY_DN5_c0_g2_i1:170-2296(+)
MMDVTADALDSRRERAREKERDRDKPLDDRRRERDSRERRDEREERMSRRGGGDYYRSSPGRDYKRRLSPSPPPYPPRDRRHSPLSRRSSPPPYKRSRRDGSYDRRGSPRYGYDIPGGYDRVGRGAYGDDRIHSRYAGRASSGGIPDWPPSGRGFGEVDPPKREGLMTYKQFISELEDDVSPAEAERRYEEYRTEYITTQKRSFFDAHKDEDWLREKYDPSRLDAVIQRRNENAKTVAKEFLADLQNDVLDIGPNVTPSSTKGGQSSDHNSDEDADFNGKRRRYARGATRENDVALTAVKAPGVSNDPRRIKKDVEITQALIRKLDAEKGIVDNILAGSEQDNVSDKSLSGSMALVIVRGKNAVKGLEGVELLDVTVTYLWRVHGLDYYGMIELKEAPKGLRHVRAENKSSYEEQSAAAAEWEKKLESTWQARLQGKDPLEVMAARDKLDAATTEALDPYVRKIRDEKYGWKYGCGAKNCSKLFHAAEYVHKHLRLKHPDLITELTAKIYEELYFENYMNDPDAPGLTLSSQPGQRDKSRRRRTSERGRDDYFDRPSRRDADRMDRSHDDERYYKDDESPPLNRHGSQDDHRDSYESFPGPGMHGSPFGPDMPPPPPVLMPVPGAGPLGPFVPAPPEIAMQMFREQGGGSFHPSDNGNHRGGRRGRSGGGARGVMDAPVILPVNPAVHHDPRRIRRQAISFKFIFPPS